MTKAELEATLIDVLDSIERALDKGWALPIGILLAAKEADAKIGTGKTLIQAALIPGVGR